MKDNSQAAKIFSDVFIILSENRSLKHINRKVFDLTEKYKVNLNELDPASIQAIIKLNQGSK